MHVLKYQIMPMLTELPTVHRGTPVATGMLRRQCSVKRPHRVRFLRISPHASRIWKNKGLATASGVFE